MKNKNKIIILMASVTFLTVSLSVSTTGVNASTINDLKITGSWGLKVNGNYVIAYVTSDGTEWVANPDGTLTNKKLWTSNADGSYTNPPISADAYLQPDFIPIEPIKVPTPPEPEPESIQSLDQEQYTPQPQQPIIRVPEIPMKDLTETATPPDPNHDSKSIKQEVPDTVIATDSGDNIVMNPATVPAIPDEVSTNVTNSPQDAKFQKTVSITNSLAKKEDLESKHAVSNVSNVIQKPKKLADLAKPEPNKNSSNYKSTNVASSIPAIKKGGILELPMMSSDSGLGFSIIGIIALGISMAFAIGKSLKLP